MGKGAWLEARSGTAGYGESGGAVDWSARCGLGDNGNTGPVVMLRDFMVGTLRGDMSVADVSAWQQ